MNNINKIIFGISIVIFIIISLIINPNSKPEITPAQLYNENNYDLVPEKPILNSIEIETKPQSECHPSYSDACLNPNASDYDCAGGSGNGPYYTGRVRVIGPDIFGLDRDRDGWGCE